MNGAGSLASLAPHPAVAITAKLKAAGAALRDPAAIRADIERVEAVLKRLKHEHLRACSRERMAKLRENPEFLRKRAEGSASASLRPELKAKRAATMLRVGQPRRLPPMTDQQKARYGYLCYGCKLPREVALKEVGAI